jgi:hypothetical protein
MLGAEFRSRPWWMTRDRNWTGAPGVGELDGVVRAHADGAAAVEGAEVAVAIHAEHVRVDTHGCVEPATRQLDIGLCSDALVLHRYLVLFVALHLWRQGDLGDGKVWEPAKLCISCSWKQKKMAQWVREPVRQFKRVCVSVCVCERETLVWRTCTLVAIAEQQQEHEDLHQCALHLSKCGSLLAPYDIVVDAGVMQSYCIFYPKFANNLFLEQMRNNSCGMHVFQFVPYFPRIRYPPRGPTDYVYWLFESRKAWTEHVRTTRRNQYPFLKIWWLGLGTTCRTCSVHLSLSLSASAYPSVDLKVAIEKHLYWDPSYHKTQLAWSLINEEHVQHYTSPPISTCWKMKQRSYIYMSFV